MTVTPRAASSGFDWGLVARYVVLIFFGFLFIFPVVFMFMSSLKPDPELLQDTTSFRAFLPGSNPTMDNYSAVFERVPAGMFIFNSIIISAITVVVGLILNSMAGFAIARMHWRGKAVILTIIIATLIVPFETIAIPLLFMVSRLPTLALRRWHAGHRAGLARHLPRADLPVRR